MHLRRGYCVVFTAAIWVAVAVVVVVVVVVMLVRHVAPFRVRRWWRG